MPTTKLSSRGQIVIPKSVREAHAWTAGQEFELIEREGELVLRPKKAFPQTNIEEAFGCLAYEGPPVPTDLLTGKEALRRKSSPIE